MDFISYRMDAFTRKRYPKSELLRFVLQDSIPVLDRTSSIKGRGFYLRKENIRPYFEKGPGKKYLKVIDVSLFKELDDA